MQYCEFQFISSSVDQSAAYKGTYNFFLVILSAVIASLAGYVALKIVDRIKQAPTSKGKRGWGIVGAIAMGIGIWSMHFTGMLAFSLPVKIYYDPFVTLISVLPGIIASAIAIYFLNAEKIGFWRLNLGGILLGVGIGTMHYTGMAAMLIENAAMYYHPGFFALSILVAHVLATFALFVKFASRQVKRFGAETAAVLSAMIMGLAIVCMHYTGMVAAIHVPDLRMTISRDMAEMLIEPGGLVFFIIFGTIIIMGITVGSTYADKYLHELRALVSKLNKEISQRKIAEEDLHKSLQEIRDIKFALDEHTIVAITDPKGIITYANDKFCSISKYAREELLGQDHRIVNSGYHPKEFMRDLWRTISSGKAWKGEIRNKAKDGSYYWVDTTIVPFLNDQGKPYQYIAIRNDITKNKINEESLIKERQLAIQLSKDAQAATEAKSKFLANMSHEIRTPMNAIVGFCDLLQKTPLQGTQKRYLEVLHSSSRLLCSVINGILDFSKLESGKAVLEKIDFNLHYLVKDTLDIVSERINKASVRTNIQIQRDVPRYLKGDPTKLRQVLLNLINNALKFTSQGQISIMVRKEEDQPAEGIFLCFTVKDTGIGIAQDKLQYIFEPFVQADTSTTRKYGGTGLGLSISKSIVEAMGGKIWVKSMENEGSEFMFNIIMQEGASVVEEDVYPVEIKAMAGLKVFIVDDSRISREVLRKLCESMGMEILAVEHSGFAALEALSRLHEQKKLPDLILSDIRMEGMSGFELIERIRADKRYAHIKAITVSSEAYDGQAAKSGAKGFNGYLSRPFTHQELARVITTVLGDKRKGGPIVTRHMANELGCKGIKVLVVEDNEPNQMLMREYAKELGYESDYVPNGQEAINRLKQGHVYDVILMDFHMPVMGGVEACEIIRRDVDKHVPVIALTAAVLEDDRKNAEAVGMNDFLTKPVNIDDLREKIIQYGRKA